MSASRRAQAGRGAGRRALLAAALVALAGGCASEGGADDDAPAPRVVPCTLGLWSKAGFGALPTPPEVEIVVGFQGFVWIDLGVRLEPETADEPAPGALATAHIGYEVSGEALRSTLVTTRMDSGAAAPLRLLLAPADAKQLAGRGLEFAARFEVGALRCDLQASLALVDLDACVHVDDKDDCGAGVGP